jgi:hypothetical protein
MTDSAVAVTPAPSTPPREVKIAILLQAILYLRGLVTFVVAYIFLGQARIHPVAVVLLLLFSAGIWSLLLCGLWWRQNWVRWLTVIWNAVIVCDALRKDIVSDRGPDILGYILIAVQVAVIVMFLRPVASHWYGRKGG